MYFYCCSTFTTQHSNIGRTTLTISLLFSPPLEVVKLFVSFWLSIILVSSSFAVYGINFFITTFPQSSSNNIIIAHPFKSSEAPSSSYLQLLEGYHYSFVCDFALVDIYFSLNIFITIWDILMLIHVFKYIGFLCLSHVGQNKASTKTMTMPNI